MKMHNGRKPLAYVNKSALIVILIILCSLLFGCSSEKTPRKLNTEDFVKAAFTMPLEDIKKIMDEEPPGSEQFQHCLDAAVPVFGKYLPDDMPWDENGIFIDLVITQTRAADQNRHFKVVSVEITEVSEDNFTYEAVIEESGDPAFRQTVHGNLQFDENDKINYFTSGGTEVDG